MRKSKRIRNLIAKEKGIGIKNVISIKKLINTLKNLKPSMKFFLDAYHIFV